MTAPKLDAAQLGQLIHAIGDELAAKLPEGATYCVVVETDEDRFIAGDGYVAQALETALADLEDDAAFAAGEAVSEPN